MKKLTLVPEASIWYRLWSMRLIVATVAYSAAAGAWMLLPPDIKPALSEGAKAVLAGIGVLLPAVAAVARVVDQPRLQPKDDGDGKA